MKYRFKKISQVFRSCFKSAVKLLFNKAVYVAVAFLAQIAWIMVLIWRLNTYSRTVSYIMTFFSILIVLKILNDDTNPSYKISWTVLILSLPLFGLAFYWLFGISRVAENMERQYRECEKATAPYLQENSEIRKKVQEENPSVSLQSAYIRDIGGFPLKANTITDFFTVGDDVFPVMLRELENAKHFIFIEYFIINDGLMWQKILEILERKAAEGVDVRLIYDGFGCLTSLPTNYYKILKEKGIKCHVFNKFRPVLNIVQNNRDHRKICVIDGYVGFTGGVNLADEYINKKERFGHWKDTAVMLRGEAVWNFTAMFLHTWSVVSGEELSDLENYMPYRYFEGEFETDGYVQPYSDSPLNNEEIGENVYLNMINKAERYVYICTPYLIIDNEMITALTLAAKSGIDVRIMTPGIPDKKIVFLLTQSCYGRLVEAGVRIYEYQPGFLHSKMFVCDDQIGVVGTINLDYRSLYLHFEDGVWMYKTRAIEEMKQDFLSTLDCCKEVTLEQIHGQSFLKRFFQGILCIIAPLL